MVDIELLREVNRDVWHAFRRTYAARDVAAFMALHAPDLIRAGGPQRQIHGYDEYAAQTGEFFTTLTERGDAIDIELRFLERIASGSLASERGVFRITAARPTGEQQVFYGRFHTYLRKEDGRWRIAADYDSNEAGTVTEETFESGVEIDNVAAFAG